MEAKMVLLWLVASTTFCWNIAMSRSHFPTLLASVVNKTGGARQAWIQGPNGYCVDVNGDVVLWQCKENPETYQLWTFESDGTIRSNGYYCLYAHLPSKKLYLFECVHYPRRNTIWEMRDDGLIVVVTDPAMSDQYALTASSGEAGAVLSVQKITYSSFQTWRFGDFEWRKRWGFIVGLHDLCMQYEGIVWMVKCNIFDNRQIWKFYPDGTIRPVQNPNTCISYEDDSKAVQRWVVAYRCGLYPTNERWWYSTSDGTFLNEKDNLVIEMINPKKVVVSPPTGIPSQKWKIEKNRGGELF